MGKKKAEDETPKKKAEDETRLGSGQPVRGDADPNEDLRTYGARLPREWKDILNTWQELSLGAEVNQLVQLALIGYMKAQGIDKELLRAGVKIPTNPLPLKRS